MANDFKKSGDTFKAINKYLQDSVGIEAKAIRYAGTHSAEGLTPIVHYDIDYIGSSPKWPYAQERTVRATVYWNNNTDPGTITRMDVTIK